MSDLPAELQIDAWAGAEVANSAPTALEVRTQLLQRGLVTVAPSLAPEVVRPEDWTHPEVGWGLVLADRDDLTAAEKARGADAPAPLRRLLAERGDAPVLRWSAAREAGILLRHYADGTVQKLFISALSYGTGKGCIPRYLLIWGSPAVVPWSVQYELQSGYFVGRLDLVGTALSAYVEALIAGWEGTGPSLDKTTVWAVDHGATDITRLMRNCIAAPLHKEFAADADPSFSIGAALLTDADAICDNLIDDLAARRPGLVVTTSHGATGPLDDVASMRTHLGLLVDDAHALLDPARLLGRWQPAGAIWFAQACCSAGSAERTAYQKLVPAGSSVERILQGVARCGATVSPLPRALLGVEAPLRAFVGHVEPTFDWTLRHPQTRQYLSKPLIRAFYEGLYLGKPIGMALAECRVAASSLNESYRLAVDRLKAGEDAAGEVFALELMSKDWRSLVLLGDPTCRLVPPPQAGGRAQPAA